MFWCIICQDILYISGDNIMIVIVQLAKITCSPPLSYLNTEGPLAVFYLALSEMVVVEFRISFVFS